MSTDKWKWMQAELGALKRAAQFRTLTSSVPLENGWILRGERSLLNLASNHYLGLENELSPMALEKMVKQLPYGGKSTPIGSTASRLIVGNDPLFSQFETEFAAYKGTESCLLYSSGYMANIGVISALVGRKDTVFSDRLNHASIVDGIVLSRAQHVRYRHRDRDHLEQLLSKVEPGSKKLIVTDAIFSMDGSLAPLKELVELKKRYGAMLMVDEAHSGGIYGPQGEGLAHALGLTDEVDIHMGTFSKAYGCCGAYIAGDQLLKEYLINKSRSFMYTTALPPMVIMAIRHNWLQVRQANQQRAELLERSFAFRTGLQRRGFDTGESECHIVPLLVGGNDDALRFSERLQELGIAAVAIRPPTVPEGTARIRFTVTAAHLPEDLEWALERIHQAGKELGIGKTKPCKGKEA